MSRRKGYKKKKNVRSVPPYVSTEWKALIVNIGIDTNFIMFA